MKQVSTAIVVCKRGLVVGVGSAAALPAAPTTQRSRARPTWSRSTPSMPAFDLDPRAHACSLAVAVGTPRVVLGEPIDVGETVVVTHLHDLPLHADVGVPVPLPEHREGHARVVAEVVESLPSAVHVDQDAVAVHQVPGRDRDRLAVGAQGRDDGRVRLLEHRSGFWREGCARHVFSWRGDVVPSTVPLWSGGGGRRGGAAEHAGHRCSSEGEECRRSTGPVCTS